MTLKAGETNNLRRILNEEAKSAIVSIDINLTVTNGYRDVMLILQLEDKRAVYVVRGD